MPKAGKASDSGIPVEGRSEAGLCSWSCGRAKGLWPGARGRQVKSEGSGGQAGIHAVPHGSGPSSKLETTQLLQRNDSDKHFSPIS